MNVGVRERKARLSAYLARVRAGETVVVTYRGRPVARWQPIPPSESPASIKHLVDSGRLIWKEPVRYLPKPVPMTPGDKTSVDFVREQRR
jgi:prevent-host-death family protein